MYTLDLLSNTNNVGLKLLSFLTGLSTVCYVHVPVELPWSG